MTSELPLPRIPRLTVAMIVRDAEELLPPTLESIRFIADEILIVDTGSSDRTRNVAVAAGAKVLSLLWGDDFSTPRNLAMAHATGEWILWLDAGETLDADTALAIKLFSQEYARADRAYLLPVEIPANGQSISSEQVGRIRLAPNFKGLQFEGRVRENMNRSLAANHIEVEALPWKIHRSTREHDQHVRSRKARRDLRLAELEMKQNGWSAPLLNVMGDAYGRLGDTAAAIDFFRRAMTHGQPGSIDRLESYYGILAAMDADPKYRAEQISISLAALEIYPLDAQLLCAMGSYLQLQGRIDLAMRAYQSAAESGQVELQTWHISDIREVATVCWCLCLQLLEQDDVAEKVQLAALANDGAAVRVRRQLIDLYIKHDKRKEALEHVNLLPPETPNREALRTAVRGACLAAKQNWSAALGYLQSAYSSGCRDAIGLRWLALTLVALNDYAGAEPIVREWKTIEPKNPEIARYLEIIDATIRAAMPMPMPIPPPHAMPPGIASPAAMGRGASTPVAGVRGSDSIDDGVQLRVDPSSPGELPAPNLPGVTSPQTARAPFGRT